MHHFRRTAPYLALSLLAFISEADGAQFIRWENRRESSGSFRLLSDMNMLSSTSNYDHEGKASAVDGLKYSKTLLDLHLLYGLTPKITGFARLSATSVTFESATLQGSGYGLGDQALGMNLRVFESTPDRKAGGGARRTTIDGQVQVEFPMYDKAGARRKDPPDPLLGDGTFDITFGPHLTHPLNQGKGTRWFLIGGLAFMLRNQNYSALIPYQVGVASQPERNGIFFRGGLYGIHPLSAEKGTVALDAGADVKDAGGSLIVDALNPSYTSARLQVGYQAVSRTQFHLGYQKTLRGSSTANLSAFTIGAQFVFGGAPSKAGGTGSSSSQTRSSYDIEARITQVGKNVVRIDRGESDGVSKGDAFDIFRTGSNGMPADVIARGVIRSVSGSTAVLQIRQVKKQVVLEPGFIVRRQAR